MRELIGMGKWEGLGAVECKLSPHPSALRTHSRTHNQRQTTDKDAKQASLRPQVMRRNDDTPGKSPKTQPKEAGKEVRGDFSSAHDGGQRETIQEWRSRGNGPCSSILRSKVSMIFSWGDRGFGYFRKNALVTQWKGCWKVCSLLNSFTMVVVVVVGGFAESTLQGRRP